MSTHSDFMHPPAEGGQPFRDIQQSMANSDDQRRINELSRLLSGFTLQSFTDADGVQYEGLLRRGSSTAVSESGAWRLEAGANGVYTCQVGRVSDGAGEVEITEDSLTFTPEKDTAVYLEAVKNDIDWDSSRLQQVTLKVGSWSGFEEGRRYTVENDGDRNVATISRFVLWQFRDSEPDTSYYSIPIGSSLYAVRMMPPYDLVTDGVAIPVSGASSGTGLHIPAIDLRPGATNLIT